MVSTGAVPNLAFRRLRGQRSAGEFAAAVRRSAREIGERVACDARYIGRVESGEIRCPNYAYERVFLHMFPGMSLADLGFSPRESVRGRGARATTEIPSPPVFHSEAPVFHNCTDEESDVLRRVFMTSGTTTVLAAASLGLGLGGAPAAGATEPDRHRVGETEVSAVESAVRRIRLLDDRHGGDGLYRDASRPLRAAYALLDSGSAARRSTADRLHAGAGELAISVGWLAHDSGRFEDARSHYAEALATARVAGDAALEAHAFCNASFLARDTGRPRESVRAAEAAQRAARPLGSPRLLALLALREAGGRAGLGDRTGCERAIGRARTAFDRGPCDADPEWMTFFREAELEMLEAQCWSALGDWTRAALHARRAIRLQDPHFTRNLALYRAELAWDLARAGRTEEAATAGHRVLDLLDSVRSSRIRTMLAGTTQALAPRRDADGVRGFLERYAAVSGVSTAAARGVQRPRG
ncbi:tetratricopeptide repeat protein [Streptomyces sp. NPDC047987]|uniref:tetratricopeptide repeat protein n=1 Tax=unclassified Streptomyces TaxID=2593676 RepID=UPI003430ABC0